MAEERLFLRGAGQSWSCFDRNEDPLCSVQGGQSSTLRRRGAPATRSASVPPASSTERPSDSDAPDRAGAVRLPSILFGLWKAVDRGWQDRFERGPSVALRWMALTARHRGRAPGASVELAASAAHRQIPARAALRSAGARSRKPGTRGGGGRRLILSPPSPFP
ncbi:uncharacterized protein SOCEGT47_022250 [Sorangium cellulosum]|uniref:Uncharacterized protein n=1 Tax=Sorangium cellulosum TaxID=56 RepID=A0A4P2PYR7_SORCE|nr:uncharacterized protein SOCEGT47_022250 [Sorangium cellulosum]